MVELAIFLALSLALTAWAYWRAHRLHREIEVMHPGFNALMRGCRKRRKRRKR